MCSHQLSLRIELRCWSRIGKGRYLTQKNSNARLRHCSTGHKGSDIKVLKMPKKKKKISGTPIPMQKALRAGRLLSRMIIMDY